MTGNCWGTTDPLAPPIWISSVYVLRDLDEVDRIYQGEQEGYIYARDGHPNGRLLAQHLAHLEKADWACVCSSGMGALAATMMALCHSGSRVVALRRLYGKTAALLCQELTRLGIQTILVESHDDPALDSALQSGPRIVVAETLSNPDLRIAHVPVLARKCHEAGALLVVDNTFATPALFRPLEHGADIVIESLTKMVGGHSDVTLGLIAGRGDQEPVIQGTLATWGWMASPFDCWLTIRSLPTLALRLGRASANALFLAQWLDKQPGVMRVIYPGLVSHPDHELAKALFGDCFGNMLAFELMGGRDAVNRFLRAAPDIPFCPSLGHYDTTCSHPASTSHRFLSPAERRRLGIGDGLIRLSVGIESAEDIKMRLEKGLRAAQAA
ncbi:MAG: PLP-dependent transferase [Gemmataceae bacterium]